MSTENIVSESSSSLSIDDRMKMHESIYEYVIPKDHYYCMRLDGHGFSKFTKGLNKPFDTIFSKSMVMCAYDALCEFNAKSAYTQSDEITLIFDLPNLEKGQNHIYNGRVQKLVSLVASFTTAKFNWHMKMLMNNFLMENPDQIVYNQATIRKINDFGAYFDARILSFDAEHKHEILNHIIWRSTKDCFRNAVQSYAYHHFSHKKIFGLKCHQMIDLLKDEKKISWENDVPLWQKHGIFIKKQLVKVVNEHGESVRTKIKTVSFRSKFCDELLDFFLESYYCPEKLSQFTIDENEL